MTAPNISDTSIFGLEKEAAEGTFLAPQGTTSYFQPHEDSFELNFNREFLDRTIMNTSIGTSVPRLGIKSVSGSFSTEMRASGTEGADVDFSPMLESALGATRAITANVTSKSSGNSGTVLAIEDADIAKFTVGDIIVIKETGAYKIEVVTEKVTTEGSATITVSPAKAAGNWSNSVAISKSKMFYTANASHPSLSLAYYWANQILQQAAGCKVTSMSIENFTVGQIPKLNFAFEGTSYGESNAAASHTPSFDTGTPPVVLSAILYKDGTALAVNNFTLTLENTLGYQTSIASANGRVASRVTERKITGTINPYMDDTTFDFFTKWDACTTFSLLIAAYNPDGTTGITLGSVVGIYLPNVMVQTYKKGNLEGLLTDEIAFTATRGSTGLVEEMYLGLI